MKSLSRIYTIAFLLVAANSSALVFADDAKKRELDQACAQARESQLGPLREQAIEECIAKKAREPQQCREYYKNYQGPPNRPGLYYDLPECKKAYDYGKSGQAK
jgi:hypothetical protein